MANSVAIVLSAASLLLGAGCTRSVTIATRGQVQKVPSQSGQVVALYADQWEAAEPASVVYLVTRTDLEQLVRRTEMHHVYYRLFACSAVRSEGKLFSSPVLLPSPAEVAEHLSPSDKGMRIYKIFLPASVDSIRRYAEGVRPGCDIESALVAAESEGLCFRLRAGAMWGVYRLTSNVVVAPVRISGESIVPASEGP